MFAFLRLQKGEEGGIKPKVIENSGGRRGRL